jgi:hypothetical protein
MMCRARLEAIVKEKILKGEIFFKVKECRAGRFNGWNTSPKYNEKRGAMKCFRESVRCIITQIKFGIGSSGILFILNYLFFHKWCRGTYFEDLKILALVKNEIQEYNLKLKPRVGLLYIISIVYMRLE